MSEGNQRPSRGGDYDYNKYYRGSPGGQGNGSRHYGPNNVPQYTGTQMYMGSEPSERQSNPYPQNSHQHVGRSSEQGSSGGGNYGKQTHSGRNTVGSHQLPFHKNFDPSHNSATMGRGIYKHQPENRGDYHLKDEFENNGNNTKARHGGRGKEGGGRGGQLSGNQGASYNYKQSMGLHHKSSEAGRLNFPPGHPDHNPHLPPPNPFSHNPTSYSSSQQSSRLNEKTPKQVRSGNDNITDGQQPILGQNRAANSPTNAKHLPTFYGKS